MKSLIIFSFLLTIGLVFGEYDTKYDDIAIEEVLANERLLSNYVKCLLSEGPCTPDGQELKDTLPDAIETDCSKCSEKQKEKSENVFHFLIDNKSEDWDQLEKIYDTEGIYREKYLMEKQLKEMNSEKSGEKA